jgi:hypothetical protein
VRISGHAWAGCITPYFALREKEEKTVMSADCPCTVSAHIKNALGPQKYQPLTMLIWEQCVDGRIDPRTQQSQSHRPPTRQKSNPLFQHEQTPMTVFAPILRIAY